MLIFFYIILGFFLNIITHTFLGSLSFISLAFLYSTALFLLFFSKTINKSLYFLSGITLAQELFGTVHLGLATTFTLIILLTYYLFANRLRFTSLSIRYGFALFFNLIFFNILLFSSTNITYRFIYSLLLFPPIFIIFYLISPKEQSPLDLL